jgi:hypothetical protein
MLIVNVFFHLQSVLGRMMPVALPALLLKDIKLVDLLAVPAEFVFRVLLVASLTLPVFHAKILVPVLVRLKFPARGANVEAALSPAVGVAMTPVPKSVSVLPVPFVTFLFCLKGLLISLLFTSFFL